MNFKIERIKKLIRNEVLKLLAEHKIKDPRVPDFLTITNISLSKDLHYCHIYFSVFGEEKNKQLAETGLNKASGFIQKVLAERLSLKYTPKIEFRYDYKDEEAYKVDKLLDSLLKERENEEI